ncbi:MAG: BTAD domain-containing putative transcriptional regulator [Solirubrobacterales bacterium]
MTTGKRDTELRLLGPLEATRGGEPVALGTPQQRALLVILALRPGEVVPRDRIVDELWGESPPDTASKLVQVYVSRLRKALEPERRGGEHEMLVTRSPGYALRIDRSRTDVGRFEDLASKGREALGAGAPAEAESLLTEALAEWRGPALADFALEPFAQAEAARLEEVRLAATEDLIDAQLALGRPGLAGEIESLISRNPFRERLRGQLMLALYREGRQSEALAAYQEARRTLVDEVGIEPGPALRELERAVLAQDPSLDPERRDAQPSEAPASATSASRRSPDDAIVGREPELRELAQRMDETLEGRGGVSLIAGEPGIGKSRLLDELAALAAERGLLVLRGRCWEAGGAPAYWPWVEALRGYVETGDPASLEAAVGDRRAELAAILPELSRADAAAPSVQSEPALARFLVFDALASFLVELGRISPVLLLLDDLHAADDPSLLMLQFLGGRAAAVPVLVVGAYRDSDLSGNPQLASTVAELGRERATRALRLGGLSRPEVGALVEQRSGGTPTDSAIAEIYTGTEGNPLFVTEVARFLQSEGRLQEAGEPAAASLSIAPGVREAIDRRLGALPGECTEILALASVLGREFEFATLLRLSERDEEELLDALEVALGARVLADVPGAPDRLRFSHVLVRDALYSGIGGPRRLRLHRDAGEVLESASASDRETHLAEIAHHFASAGAAADPGKAIAYSRAAAERAVTQTAYEEAVRHYEVALELLGPEEEDTAGERAAMLLDLGAAQARAGAEEDAKASALRAAELAKAAGDPELLARAAVEYGGRFLWSRAVSDPRLVPLIEEALEAIGDGDSEARVRLLSRLGAALRGEPTRERRERVAEDAIATARRLGDSAIVAYALDANEAALHGPDTLDRVLSEARELVELATEIGDAERLFDGHEHVFWSSWIAGDLEGRNAALTAMSSVAKKLGQPSQLWSAAAARAATTLAEGRFAEAESEIDAAAGVGARALGWSADLTRRYQLLALWRERDQLGEHGDGLLGPPESFPSPLVHKAFTAYIDLKSGREAEAAEALRRVCERDLRSWHVDEEWLSSLFLLSEVCCEAGEREQAAELYEALLPYAPLNAIAVAEVGFDSVSRPLGNLAAMLGRSEEARRHFADAIEMNARMSSPHWVERAERELAGVTD